MLQNKRETAYVIKIKKENIAILKHISKLKKSRYKQVRR